MDVPACAGCRERDARIAELEQRVAELETLVRDLTARLGINSSNSSVPPSANPNSLGVVGGDNAGYPNGRRLVDDVTTIAIRAVAGVTYPLVNKSYKPDAAASLVTQGITPLASRTQAAFPYVANPHGGYQSPSATE